MFCRLLDHEGRPSQMPPARRAANADQPACERQEETPTRTAEESLSVACTQARVGDGQRCCAQFNVSTRRRDDHVKSATRQQGSKEAQEARPGKADSPRRIGCGAAGHGPAPQEVAFWDGQQRMAAGLLVRARITALCSAGTCGASTTAARHWWPRGNVWPTCRKWQRDSRPRRFVRRCWPARFPN